MMDVESSPRDAADSADSAGMVGELDAGALKALAHPSRVRLWELLYEHGPATASHLAARSGENTGVVSYHLRELARHGLIEDAPGRSPGRGKGRERWWRAAPGGFSFRPDLFAASGDSESAGAAELLLSELVRLRVAELTRFQQEAKTMPRAWVEASVNSSYSLTLTRDELAAFVDEVLQVIARYRSQGDAEQAAPSAARVAVQFHAFPVGLSEEPDPR